MNRRAEEMNIGSEGGLPCDHGLVRQFIAVDPIGSRAI